MLMRIAKVTEVGGAISSIEMQPLDDGPTNEMLVEDDILEVTVAPQFKRGMPQPVGVG